jgi:desampylase
MWRMVWTVTSDAHGAMLRAAAAAHPLECCGLLLGRGQAIAEAVPVANVAEDPARRFAIDPAALIAAHRAARGGGRQVLGYYHSHPTGDARPSATDRAEAAGDGRVWAIVAGGAVCWWRDEAEGGLVQLSCSVVPG